VTRPASASKSIVKLRILAADYKLSAARGDGLPPATAPEIAFIGRSNVGKSSLINALTARRSLARTSRTPGQTRNINVFVIEVGRVGHQGTVTEKRVFELIDLPGYGFAKLAAKEQARLSRLLSHYLSEREGLRAVVQLLDARHVATPEDVEVYQGLHESGREVVLVGTKIDRVASAKRKAQIRALVAPLGVSASVLVPVSSTEDIGRQELWTKLWDLAK
jgi:GTP-binding protein